MNISYKIMDIRKKNNLTQEQLAEKLNVSRQTVSNWENGKFYPDIDTLIKISNIFGISLDVLLKEDTIMIKKMDKKIKMNRKLTLAIILIIICVIGSIPVILNYQIKADEAAKMEIKNQWIKNQQKLAQVEAETPNYIVLHDGETVFSLNFDRINGETRQSLTDYYGKEVALYLDEDDLNANSNKPLFARVLYEKKHNNPNELLLALKDDDYENLAKKIHLGYNFRIELK